MRRGREQRQRGVKYNNKDKDKIHKEKQVSRSGRERKSAGNRARLDLEC